MSGERRIARRKAYAIPVRFNVITQELVAVRARAKSGVPRGATKFLETIPLHSKVKPSIYPNVGLASRPTTA
jgi:hypothetical protein